MLARLVRFVRRNPILSALWGLFSAAFLYVVQQEYTADKQIAELRTLALQVQQDRGEFGLAQTAVKQHDEALGALREPSGEALSHSLQLALKDTTDNMIERYEAQRLKLEEKDVLIDNLYFDNPSLKTLQSGLVKDLQETETFLARRISFLKLIETNMPMARAEAAEIQANEDGERYAMEAAARQATSEHILDEYRQKNNAAGDTYNAARQMYFWRANIEVAAWAYLAGSVGAFCGFLIARRRRKRLAVLETDATAASDLDESTRT
jgi:hypothetical protein